MSSQEGPVTALQKGEGAEGNKAYKFSCDRGVRPQIGSGRAPRVEMEQGVG